MQQRRLGRELRSYRRRRDVSQQELAIEMGWAHKSAISRRESGEIIIDVVELLELCAGVERVIRRRDEMNEPAEVLSE